MKKLLVPLAVLLLLALAVPAAFAEVELGISATPAATGQGATPTANESDWITGFHVGYNWGILYGTWDALAMPPRYISNMTGYWDTTQSPAIYVDGPYLPGFLNLFDVGLRIMLRPFVIYTTVGVNNIYVYDNLGGGSFGANLRIGAGLRFGFWGVNLSGTAVFPSFGIMASTLGMLVAQDAAIRNQAVSVIGDNLVPSINLTLYF